MADGSLVEDEFARGIGSGELRSASAVESPFPKSGAAVFAVSAQMRRKDGSLIWTRLVGRAIDPADGSKGSVWVIDDITAGGC